MIKEKKVLRKILIWHLHTAKNLRNWVIFGPWQNSELTILKEKLESMIIKRLLNYSQRLQKRVKLGRWERLVSFI